MGTAEMSSSVTINVQFNPNIGGGLRTISTGCFGHVVGNGIDLVVLTRPCFHGDVAAICRPDTKVLDWMLAQNMIKPAISTRWEITEVVIGKLSGLGVETVHDVGCGPGWFLDKLLQLGLTVTGLEVRQKLSQEARCYAHHFFFRRMIPLPFMAASSDGICDLDLDNFDTLGPGRWPGLDIMCDGILEGKPFIYPAEQLGIHDAPASNLTEGAR